MVFDYVLASKKMTPWLTDLITTTIGTDKFAILDFAAIAVILVAIVGAVSSYAEKYLTMTVGQWVMHEPETNGLLSHSKTVAGLS